MSNYDTKQPFLCYSLPYKTLPDSDHPVFTSLDFATIILFDRARSSTLHPTHNLEGQVPVFMFPSDRVAQLYPQAPGSRFFAFYDSQGYPPPHMEIRI
jgi:hypothetical protein